MESITNEFNEDLVYTLTDDNGEVIEETVLPSTGGKEYIKTAIKINASETKNYTLKVEYKYLDTPQNDYQGKSFNATLGIDTDKVELSFTGLCRRAEVLHTEECTQNDYLEGYFCHASGYTEDNKGTTIVYGNLGIKGNLSSGDAFDCDVNGDGEYNSENERFYYVSDYYNTSTKQFESDTATLIYYNDTLSGNSNSVYTTAYTLNTTSPLEPSNLLEDLPKRNQWTNTKLLNGNRNLLNSDSSSLNINLNYDIYAGRLLTIQEVLIACNIDYNNEAFGNLDSCNYLLENTKFAYKTNSWGYWLENPYNQKEASYVDGGYRRLYHYNAISDTTFSVRPAIDVPKTNIEI